MEAGASRMWVPKRELEEPGEFNNTPSPSTLSPNGGEGIRKQEARASENRVPKLELGNQRNGGVKGL
jgi:hypothetical protein